MTPEVLERERPYLMGIAYRMLGSHSDAEDVVQDALARAVAIEDARTPRALLTTIVTRLCLDELRSARRRRETYVGPWLPEPVLTGEPNGGSGSGPRADDRIDTAESVSMAFLLLLESLTPHERAVFILREVLDLDFAEIAEAVDRSQAACRQLLHRARGHISAGRRRFPAAAARRDLASRFLAALAAGDTAAMVELLVDDAACTADHGGKAQAAQRVVVGADRVARLLDGLNRKAVELGVAAAPAWINGNPALVACVDGAVDTVLVLDTAMVSVDGGPERPRVVGVHVMRNPDKLGGALHLLPVDDVRG